MIATNAYVALSVPCHVCKVDTDRLLVKLGRHWGFFFYPAPPRLLAASYRGHHSGSSLKLMKHHKTSQSGS